MCHWLLVQRVSPSSLTGWPTLAAAQSTVYPAQQVRQLQSMSTMYNLDYFHAAHMPRTTSGYIIWLGEGGLRYNINTLWLKQAHWLDGNSYRSRLLWLQWHDKIYDTEAMLPSQEHPLSP
jgi:hypothetical protein